MANDFGRLARRISSITTNCLLTAVVLVAGLGFGRQVLRWWAEEPGKPAGGLSAGLAGDGLGDPSRLHIIEFGDRPWSIRRQSIGGDQRAAAAALRAVCREVLTQSRLPDLGVTHSEQRLLGRLAAEEPIEQEPGQWRLYEVGEAFPMVIGTQPQAPRENPGDGGNLVAAPHRMVVWGLALPAGPEAWTVLSFQPEGGPHSGLLPELPIPAGCRRTLCVRVAGGGATLGFEGEQTAEECIGFFEQWFAARNWHSETGWQEFGERWYARYCRSGDEGEGDSPIFASRKSGQSPSQAPGQSPSQAPGQSPAQAPGQSPAEESPAVVDVHFSRSGSGGCSGLVVISGSW